MESWRTRYVPARRYTVTTRTYRFPTNQAPIRLAWRVPPGADDLSRWISEFRNSQQKRASDLDPKPVWIAKLPHTRPEHPTASVSHRSGSSHPDNSLQSLPEKNFVRPVFIGLRGPDGIIPAIPHLSWRRKREFGPPVFPPGRPNVLPRHPIRSFGERHR
jgi:hypothetical protein